MTSQQFHNGVPQNSPKLFLDALVKLRKETIILVTSVYLPVRQALSLSALKQLGFHWADFHKILCLRLFENQ